MNKSCSCLFHGKILCSVPKAVLLESLVQTRKKNPVHQTQYFKQENVKNQVQIDKGVLFYCYINKVVLVALAIPTFYAII